MADYQKGAMLYEGKAKKVFYTDDPEVFIVSYKDDATAFNGEKRGTIEGKGIINNRMTNRMMQLLGKHAIPTHFVAELSERETAVKKVNILPLEVIVRNRAAGSFAKRYGVEEGKILQSIVLEFSYKNDALGDPLINDSHIFALGLATEDELELVKRYALRINETLRAFFKDIGVELIDFKIEFGKDSEGNIILADEISPDTCRFWDIETGEKLDKDRFRRDMGHVEDAYEEMFRRIESAQ